MSDGAESKHGPSAGNVLVNMLDSALDVQKECLAKNPTADLSPNYIGLFHAGDPGVYPIIGIGPFSF